MGARPNSDRVLEIRLLGEPLLSYRGTALPFRAPRRALALLAYLVLHAGELQRDRVAYALWPDVAEDRAKDNLRRHLHLLQAALPDAAVWLRAGRRTVAWNGNGRAWVDALVFDAGGELDDDSAVELYRDDLLTGFDDEWIVPYRERYRRRCAERLRSLVLRRLEHGDADAATEYGIRLLRFDPFREDDVRRLMEVRATARDRAGAAKLYHDLVRRLRDELGVEPDAETSRAYDDLVARDDPALRAVPKPSPRGVIALPATSFYGRERDVEMLGHLLESRRLITLTGPGGVGKTRLATEAAARMEPRFEDAVHVVDLAPVEDGALIAERMVQALGVRQPPGTTAEAALLAELRERDVLLVLDNCEHVLADVAHIAETLVRSTDRVRALVTSRAALRVPEEIVYHVQPLLVSAGSRLGGEDALHGPAVRLFIDRAVARDRSLDLAPHAKTIAGLCAKLDGLPLAIEIAAMNFRGTDLETLAATIGERVDLLGEGWRTASPRQRTLEAVFAWSFQLLDEPLRRLFLRLAVFRGGFTVDAARAVCDRSGADLAMRQLLAALAERSLLSTEEARGETRYRMLETTRAFAAGKLGESGDASAAERAHGTFFAGIAEQARAAYEHASDDVWLPPLYAEVDNFGAALERTLGAGREPQLGAAIAGGLADFWLTCGQESVAARWLEAAAALDPDCVHARVGLAAVYRRGYRFADALATVEPVIPALRESSDTATLCRALVVAGNSIVSSAVPGDRVAAERGRALVLESLRIAEQQRYAARTAEAHFALGLINDYLGDLAAALQEFEASQRLFRSAGKTMRAEHTGLSIAVVSYLVGDLDRAEAIARELTADSQAFNSMQLAHAFELLGTIAFDRGGVAAARAHMERALTLTIGTGQSALVDACLPRIARIQAAGGRPEDAIRLFAYARRCEENGALLRHPRERDAEAQAIVRLRQVHGDSFVRHWDEGYTATRGEMVRLVLGRDVPEVTPPKL
ncbi:MAG: hypothetical protein JWM87_3820 [Candidatus Eremiobacteraeota bacterium]|nr:hypothetical protein [Candidatus Eremiobacteraeota bacterium]